MKADSLPFPVTITSHARSRFKERVRAPLRSIKRQARRALLHGTDVCDLRGGHAIALRTVQETKHGRGELRRLYLYQGHIWVFDLIDPVRALSAGIILVTILPPYRGQEDD